jgi:eukaryotic-like serine/threonine-protein kinase
VSGRRFPSGFLIRDTYTIVRHLGSGAFGDVYLARHRYMGLQALKVFPLEGHNDALEEAYLLTKLSHPNIVRMFEANEFKDGTQHFGYFSMEYVEEGTLSDYLGSTAFNMDARVNIARGFTSGLAFAHAQRPPIIHRDISPSNVLVSKEDGHAIGKIGDFGLAKPVDTALMLASAAGKYVYMSPESFLGKHYPASDVYSAGIVIFEMITGSHPFQLTLKQDMAPQELAAIVRHSRTKPVPTASNINPDLGREWNEFFRRVLAHDFEERPHDANSLCELLEGTLHRNSRTRIGDEVKQIIEEAMRLSQQIETLDKAIALLDGVCAREHAIASEYGETLALWKKGIVM